MQVHRCTIVDTDRINAILRHPSVYGMISDDGSPEANDCSAKDLLQSSTIHYLLVGEDTLFLLYPMNFVCYQVHVAALPSGRGETIRKACMAVIEWMWTNTPARKIVGIFPESNVKAYALCRRVGMAMEGRITKSFQRQGRLMDQIVMGLCRED